MWPRKRPMRRAAAWDGAVPQKAGAGFESQMTPQEMAEASAFVTSQRPAGGPYDMVHTGLLSGHRAADEAAVLRYHDVGVTWWLEHIYPGRMTLSEIREFIRLGPPRTS